MIRPRELLDRAAEGAERGPQSERTTLRGQDQGGFGARHDAHGSVGPGAALRALHAFGVAERMPRHGVRWNAARVGRFVAFVALAPRVTLPPRAIRARRESTRGHRRVWSPEGRSAVGGEPVHATLRDLVGGGHL